ncbi:MAG TPA: NAD(P)/FAD-dependent oxidoreductase [Solirubrobacter sp.]|nr:NAD(P)/FAD-dependent oxidoreductase [Solirubrobacter sp.]
MESTWDCIVIGAGAAGLSAALVLGRARRRTLVIDAGGQSNRFSEGIGGLLGQDGRPPAAFYAHGREELAAYPSVELREGTVVAAREGFEVALADGTVESATAVLLATGMEYRYPNVPGIAERWGRSVFHCPFCHGWEHRDGRLAVLDVGGHRPSLLGLWSDDVALLTNGQPPEDVPPGVEVDTRVVARLEGSGSSLTAVVFEDGSSRECTGLLVPVTLHQRTDLAVQLGAELAEPGPVAKEAIAVDAQYRTSVPGLFAAGDATTQMPSVAAAIAAGHMAAAAIVADVVAARSAAPA